MKKYSEGFYDSLDVIRNTTGTGFRYYYNSNLLKKDAVDVEFFHQNAELEYEFTITRVESLADQLPIFISPTVTG